MEQIIYILWDASHIWGLMAWRTLTAMGLPIRLVKAEEITHGLLSCKSPSLLLVPGGTARLKAQALGPLGCQAIRDYVASGGQYLGFCGGAGLGLSTERTTGAKLNTDEGLSLCPWSRSAYTHRMQHLVSGHVLAQVTPHALSPVAAPHLSLPVWWPGRFAPQANTDVEVLARYETPGHDLCLADIPLHSLPQDIFTEWQQVYGVDMGADFLTGQPCIISGQYGKGHYVLSYSHLETPDSPDANGWLAHILAHMSGLHVPRPLTGPWEVDLLPQAPGWQQTSLTSLLEACAGVTRLMDLGAEHNLLFRRTPWLRGWRTGIPGAALNNVHTALCTALSLDPNEQALTFWHKHKESFERALPLFLKGVEGYLLAERLATTLSSSLPDVVDRTLLKERREGLFGKPMQADGLYQQLLNAADDLVFLLTQRA